MKLEQDLPTGFERLYFFKKYDLILKTTISIDFIGVVTQNCRENLAKWYLYLFVKLVENILK